uniref:ubiquitinyl hydrolase 1 n=1 Tax=Ditylenchus dipsaci TaxID=166011 RepID=A0A915DZT1_9BILA
MSDEISPEKPHFDSGSESGSETDGNQYFDEPGQIFECNRQPGICGLSNLGNTCFMNSALQCMANVPQLVEFFVSGQYHSQISKSNKKTRGSAVAKEFGKLVQQMWCGEHDSLAPQNFRSEITEIAPDFKGHHQHDTQEFTMFLLDGLHDDLNRANKDQSLPNREYGPEVPHKEVADATWRKYKSDNDSIVTDLFHGQLKSTTICKNCSAESVTFDPFCYLSLSLPPPLPSPTTKDWVFITNEPKEQEVSISECLRNFTEPEQIEKNCQCGSQCCEKTLNIWRLPEILVVHLKRYQDFNLEDAVANSEEKHQLYELISATFHTGSLTDGHYTACVLKDAWRSVPNVNLREASSDDVYVLYYRKMASPLSRHTGCDGRAVKMMINMTRSLKAVVKTSLGMHL